MQLRSLLSLTALLLCLLPLPGVFAQDDAFSAEIFSYRLSMESAYKVDAVNRAMQKAFAEAGEDDPQLFGDESSLDALEAGLKKNPIAAAALRSAGISAREYLRFLSCWAQTSMYTGLVRDGVMSELPADVLPENARFVEDHADELEAMSRGWER
jgi:hypothetical protein